MKKLLTMLISLWIIGVSGCAFAGTESLTHFGISLMRTPDTLINNLVQVNGALVPSIEREMIPYSDWQKRLYGYIGYEVEGQNYSFGVGYYLGRVGMVGIQAGLQNDKEQDKDIFIYGIYLDGNVFKEMLRRLIGSVKRFE